jgi:hypothetical protein
MIINKNIAYIIALLAISIIIYLPRHIDTIAVSPDAARFLLRDLISLALILILTLVRRGNYLKLLSLYVKISVIVGVVNFLYFLTQGDIKTAFNPRDWHYLLPSADLSLLLLVISATYLHKIGHKLTLSIIGIFVIAGLGTRTALLVILLYIALQIYSKGFSLKRLIIATCLFIFIISLGGLMENLSPKIFELYKAVFIEKDIYQINSVQDLLGNHVQNVLEEHPVTLFGNSHLIMQGVFESGLISDSGLVILALTKGYFGLILHTAIYVLIFLAAKKITYYTVFVAIVIFFASVKGYYYDSAFLIVLTLIICLNEREKTLSMVKIGIKNQSKSKSY